MKRLHYFNGFNSAIPAEVEPGSKLDEVRLFCERAGYAFCPVSIDYRRAAQQREEILAGLPGNVEEIIFSGSSMGGWFARILQVSVQRPDIPVIGLAFNPVAHLEKLRGFEGPQMNFVTGERYHWGADDTGRLLALEASVDFEAARPFWVFCDQGDELIDWRDMRARYAPFARFHAFPGGEHRFIHARESLELFARGL